MMVHYQREEDLPATHCVNPPQDPPWPIPVGVVDLAGTDGARKNARAGAEEKGEMEEREAQNRAGGDSAHDDENRARPKGFMGGTAGRCGQRAGEATRVTLTPPAVACDAAGSEAVPVAIMPSQARDADR